jgi:glycosyltransferase involved in cell wall biosynthesis
MIISKAIYWIRNNIKHFLYIHFHTFIILFRDIENSFFFNDFLIRKKLLFINPKNFEKDNIDNDTKKKKIIIVIGDLTRGGAERQVIKLAEYLLKKKIKVKIFSNVNKKKKSQNYPIPKNIHVDYIKNKRYNFINSADREFFDSLNRLNFFSKHEKEKCLALYNYLKIEKPDVVHAFLDFNCIISGYVGLYLNIRRIILSTRNVSPDHFLLWRPYFKEFYKSFLKFNNITLVNNSKAGAKSYEKWLGIKRNSIKITYNIFDFNKKIKFKKIHLKKKLNSINFGSLIRLDAEKNPEYLLKLATNLIKQNSNYYFYILGIGILHNKIKNYIKKKKLAKNIKLLGIKDNIYDYLKFFNFTLLTSKQEGTPNVLLESQRVGTRVITTDSGGSKETFIKKYSGYLIGGKSIVEDCRIINNIVSKNIKSKKLDLKIIKKKLIKFSPSHAVRQVLNLYKSKHYY